jgi:hypothetical protein
MCLSCTTTEQQLPHPTAPQLAFEEFGFQALYMAPAPYFALRDHASRSLQVRGLLGAAALLRSQHPASCTAAPAPCVKPCLLIMLTSSHAVMLTS